jgi:hypothetical protein
MATQAASHVGFITGTSQANQAAARDATSGTATNAPSGNQSAMQYFQSSGRGGGTFRYIRAFFRFDTSGISGASNFVLNVPKYTASGLDTDNVFVMKSTAFNGEDNTLEGNDFDNLGFGSANLYSNSATGDAWSTGASGTNNITLNAAFASFANAQSVTRVALITSLDFNDTGLEEDGDVTNGINFSGTIQLTFTAAASGYTHDVLGVAAANIAKVNGIATANIGKVITVN